MEDWNTCDVISNDYRISSVGRCRKIIFLKYVLCWNFVMFGIGCKGMKIANMARYIQDIKLSVGLEWKWWNLKIILGNEGGGGRKWRGWGQTKPMYTCSKRTICLLHLKCIGDVYFLWPTHCMTTYAHWQGWGSTR